MLYKISVFSSEAHPPSYPMDAGGSFSQG